MDAISPEPPTTAAAATADEQEVAKGGVSDQDTQDMDNGELVPKSDDHCTNEESDHLENGSVSSNNASIVSEVESIQRREATDRQKSEEMACVLEESGEESEDFVELPAVTKPLQNILSTTNSSTSTKLTKKGQEVEKALAPRGRSNSLFKILGKRQKLVEKACEEDALPEEAEEVRIEWK